ncbi:substrate-binding domain-containing protein [Catenulispora sp. GP43]|uniref:substrate-binding domain-containing protein n=1 Tax=Catenulispora sp. GP43 TaxID=3156263 RepID=UPI003513A9DC
MASAVLAFCFFAAGVGPAPASAAAYVPITGAGSTWVGNAMNQWTSQVAQQGVQVSYAGTGSTDGRIQFRGGSVDFAVSDVPYGLVDKGVVDPLPAQPFAYAPIAGNGLAFMYHLTSGGHEITGLRLDPVTGAKVFTGVITTGNDPEIAGENPGVALPAREIVPVVRSDGAGTSAQLTAWFANQPSLAPIWNAYCAASGRATPCGQTSYYPVPSSAGAHFVAQSLDTGVADYVAQPSSEGAITYTGYSYALQSGFPVAKLLNAGGAYVLPAAGNVAVALQSARVDAQGLADVSRVYTSGDPRAYPLSNVSYMIVPLSTAAPFTTAKGLTLGTFADYALCPGQQTLAQQGSAPLAPSIVQTSLATIAKVPGAGDNASPACTDQTAALIADTPQPPPCDMAGSTVSCTTGANPVPALAISPGGAAHQGDPVSFTATVDPGLAGTFTLAVTAGPQPATPLTFADVDGTGNLVLTTLAAGSYEFVVSFTPSGGPAWTTSSQPVDITIAPINHAPVETVTTVLPPGALAIAVSGAPTVVLPDTVLNPAGDLFQTTGALTPIVVTDNRAASPGWTATATVTDFSDTAGHSFDGANLGWTPSVIDTSPAQTVTAGPSVAPNANGGLKAGTTLASCSGLGTVHLGAALQLDVPTSTIAGTYTATMTFTVL